MESVARWRIMNGHRDENGDPFLDEFNVMHWSQLQQTLLFRHYSPIYLQDLLVLNGLSDHNIWRMNGHDGH